METTFPGHSDPHWMGYVLVERELQLSAGK